MPPPLLTANELKGVYERLAITDQNINNLRIDIAKFLKPFPTVKVKGKNGKFIYPKRERDAWTRLQKAAKEQETPLRFRVRAGEVIHQLRSCLDNIAWLLSDPIKREEKPGKVYFPIITDWTDPDEVSRFNGQTAFITNPAALGIIRRLQPATGSVKPKEDPLWHIHHMDIVDKHRELIVTLYIPHIFGPTKVSRDVAPVQYADGRRGFVPIIGTSKVETNLTIALDVAFKHFIDGKERSVIEALSDLTNAVRDSVALFAE